MSIGAHVLDLAMGGDNSAHAGKIRTYLKALLHQMVVEGEGFSGKRPFGDSGWEWELYKPLVVAGLAEGSIDSDGFIDKVDERAARKLILLAIEAL